MEPEIDNSTSRNHQRVRFDRLHRGLVPNTPFVRLEGQTLKAWNRHGRGSALAYAGVEAPNVDEIVHGL